MSALVARDLTKAYGDRVVLDGVDLLAQPGRPLGLVGENGAGKSTLLRLVAGVEPADSGTVVRPPDLGYLGQEVDFADSVTVGDVFDEALAPLHDAVAELERLAAGLDDEASAEAYDALLTWVTLHDAWNADHRAEIAASRLGLARVSRERAVASLSGGQRSRLALAALITRRPACVLLDEPTNHLDDEAAAQLEQFLVSLPGVVVVASHDRTFLDAVCRVVVDLDPAHLGVDGEGGSRFTGDYTEYLAAKRQARRRWQEAFEAQQHELDELRRSLRTTARQVAHDRGPSDGDKFIYHFKGSNVARTVSRRVNGVRRRIEVLERTSVPKPPTPLSFRADLAPGASPGRQVVHIDALRVTDRLAVDHLSVSAGEHLLITGTNGSGKSTLLQVLAGRLPATTGTVDVHARRAGLLPQDVTFKDPSRTPLQVYDAGTGSRVPITELGLLHPRDLSRPVGVLSVGQQRRLALAILVTRRPDLLLLDEPTNHLSLALADELEEAIGHSPGCVIVASHDRWLRNRWQGRQMGLVPCGPREPGPTATPWLGGGRRSARAQ